MKFYIPTELTDPTVRTCERISHGENRTIDILAAEVEALSAKWLGENQGWTYSGTNIMKCEDGTPPPAYDVCLGFKRPKTDEERIAQEKDREAYLAHKEADFKRREEEQKVLLSEILASLDHSKAD